MVSWPHVSGYVHINKALSPAEGSVILFRVKNRRFAKVAKRAKYSQINPVTGAREYWVSADNAAMTGEGSDFSDQYKWVPEAWLIGVVDVAWTPLRAFRSGTVGGKFQNWTELNLPPESMKRSDGGAVAAISIAYHSITIYESDEVGQGKIVHAGRYSPGPSNGLVGWLGDKLIYAESPTPEYQYRYWKVGATGYVFIVPPQLEYERRVILPQDLPDAKRSSDELDLKTWLAKHGGRIIIYQPQQMGLKPQALVDGDPITCWGPIGEDSRRQVSRWTIDLGRACPSLRQVELSGLKTDGSRVKLSWSRDGKLWQESAETVIHDADTSPTLALTATAPEAARYWQVSVVGPGWLQLCRLGELRFKMQRD